MEINMSNQSYTSTYRTAMEAAKVELEALFEDAKRLRNRMEQIDSAIIALKPLTGLGGEGLESQSSNAHSQDAGFSSMKQQIDAALGMAFA
jgi:hypothetical protein